MQTKVKGHPITCLLEALRGDGGAVIIPTNSQPVTRSRWVFSTKFRPLYPRKDSVRIVHEAEWASRSLWTACKISAPHRNSVNGPSSPWRFAIPTDLSGPLNANQCGALIRSEMFWTPLWRCSKIWNSKSVQLSNDCLQASIQSHPCSRTRIKQWRNKKNMSLHYTVF